MWAKIVAAGGVLGIVGSLVSIYAFVRGCTNLRECLDPPSTPTAIAVRPEPTATPKSAPTRKDALIVGKGGRVGRLAARLTHAALSVGGDGRHYLFVSVAVTNVDGPVNGFRKYMVASPKPWSATSGEISLGPPVLDRLLGRRYRSTAIEQGKPRPGGCASARYRPPRPKRR